MNILIPHSWLLEHLDTTATPAEIQREVSLCGPSIERIYDREGESVYDIEITTNRVDSMSVRGVAREAAVILTQAGFPSTLKPLAQSFTELVTKASKEKTLTLPKIKNDPALCYRTLCVALSDVKRTPTPDWMAKRLRQVEMNVHDSVIDITNYVTHDLGHPCHAFDYDKIMALGGEINVKIAEAGKHFMTLDGVSYETNGSEVVFENAEGEIIDLPAIKGTANTAIDNNTKNVLFWIETIDAKRVRAASMSHAIRTVAAQLNEKKVDPHQAEPVFAAGVELYQTLCHAKLASPVTDNFPVQLAPQEIVFELREVERYLGVQLATEDIFRILESLDCQVRQEQNTLYVTPPTFRPDLEIAADIVEEIARIYGYHRLPSKVMPTPIPTTYPVDVDFHLENKVKHFLADLGWQELYTYSTVSNEIAAQSGYPVAEHLSLQNPLTDDHVALRRSLIPSLAEIASLTSTPKPASVFEIANVYHPQTDALPEEELHLSLLSQQPYRVVRGHLEALLRRVYVPTPTITPLRERTGWDQVAQLEITSDQDPVIIGYIGLAQGNVAIDIMWQNLLQVARKHPRYQALPKTMPIIEDLTFTITAEAIGPVIEQIKAVSPLISKVELKDIYNQNYTFTIHYWKAEDTITAEEVEPLRRKIVDTLLKETQAQLVGALHG